MSLKSVGQFLPVPIQLCSGLFLIFSDCSCSFQLIPGCSGLFQLVLAGCRSLLLLQATLIWNLHCLINPRNAKSFHVKGKRLCKLLPALIETTPPSQQLFLPGKTFPPLITFQGKQEILIQMLTMSFILGFIRTRKLDEGQHISHMVCKVGD